VQLTNAGLNVGSLAVGDFNEDGKADLVVATIAGGQVSIVLLGNGDGTFSQQPPIPNSFGFFHARIVDLNGDGHQDLVFAMNGSLGVSLGKGDGTFGAMTSLPGGSFPGMAHSRMPHWLLYQFQVSQVRLQAAISIMMGSRTC